MVSSEGIIYMYIYGQFCQNILFLKYYNSFWQRLRIKLNLYFLAIKYFKILKGKIAIIMIKSALSILIYLIHISSIDK